MYVPCDHITAVDNYINKCEAQSKALNEELACMAARSNTAEGL